MKTSLRRWLFWTPRILCILFAGFLSVFDLDAFGEGLGFWETALAFLIHLIPTWLVLAALALSWRWEWAGGVAFVGLGLFYLFTTWGRFPWNVYLIIVGPLFLVGGLFLVNWLYRTEIRTST